MSFLTFFTATYFLLAVPGPTNALFATSGAGIGISRSLHLLVAELAGYLMAIALLRLALGPLVSDIPIAALVLRVAVTVYILGLAFMLWWVNTRELRDGAAHRRGHAGCRDRPDLASILPEGLKRPARP
jgi:threonine/homoserine/homoserine lactone efflux protein